MADPVTDPVAEHDARYGEEGAAPPNWARDLLAFRFERASGSLRPQRIRVRGGRYVHLQPK
jgi:hypothetical protein